MALCSACGTDNRADARFCGGCGASLALACPGCGAENEADRRFCYQCGAALSGVPAEPVVRSAAARRLVSVLFVDLVGFTTASEARDA